MEGPAPFLEMKIEKKKKIFNYSIVIMSILSCLLYAYLFWLPISRRMSDHQLPFFLLYSMCFIFSNVKMRRIFFYKHHLSVIVFIELASVTSGWIAYVVTSTLFADINSFFWQHVIISIIGPVITMRTWFPGIAIGVPVAVAGFVLRDKAART